MGIIRRNRKTFLAFGHSLMITKNHYIRGTYNSCFPPRNQTKIDEKQTTIARLDSENSDRQSPRIDS